LALSLRRTAACDLIHSSDTLSCPAWTETEQESPLLRQRFDSQRLARTLSTQWHGPSGWNVSSPQRLQSARRVVARRRASPSDQTGQLSILLWVPSHRRRIGDAPARL